jgi:hypothetical protein
VSSTRPPLTEFGVVKIEFLPCSEIDIETFVASVPPPPQPAATNAAARTVAAAKRHAKPGDDKENSSQSLTGTPDARLLKRTAPA